MIHSIQIKNYKSIRDITVELSPVTVLVGRSGTGKSNFFNAISQLQCMLIAKKSSRTWPSHLGQKSDEFLFDCCFSVSGIEERFNYRLANREVGSSAGGFGGGTRPMVLEERLMIGESVLFHHGPNDNAQPAWVTPPDITQVPAPNGIMLGQLPALTKAVIAFTSLTAGVGFYDFSDAVLTNANQQNGSQQHSTGLTSNASNFLAVLQAISQNLQNIRLKQNLAATLRRVNPSIESIELNDLQSPTSVVVAHRYFESGKLDQLSLTQESAGVRRFLAHLLALYQQPPKQTLIFEHPEDGIHPGAMELLAEEFIDAALEGRGQVLLSTHNPMLLDQFDVDQIRVVELDASETTVGPVEEAQRDAVRQNLINAGELLTTDPARMQHGS